MTDSADATHRMQDQFVIRDTLARYARGVDRCDWDSVRKCFHPDATDDHGAYRGGVDGFIDWVSRRHALIEQSMHFLGNCVVDFCGGDVARVETYFSAYQRLGAQAAESRRMLLGDAAADGALDVTVLGRYVDRFERRAGTWRIARRITVYEAIRTAPVADAPHNPAYRWARRDRSDPLFAMQDESADHADRDISQEK